MVMVLYKQTKMVFTMEQRGKNAERMYDEWRMLEEEEMLEDLTYSDDARVRYLANMENYINGMKNRKSVRMPKVKCTPSQQTEYKLKKEFKRQRAEHKKAEDTYMQNKRRERTTVVKEQHENQDDEDCYDMLAKDQYWMEREQLEWEYLYYDD